MRNFYQIVYEEVSTDTRLMSEVEKRVKCTDGYFANSKNEALLKLEKNRGVGHNKIIRSGTHTVQYYIILIQAMEELER